MKSSFRFVAILAALVLSIPAFTFAAATSARMLLNKPLDWYKTDDARRAAENILSYQTDLGDWPKNVDTAGRPFTGDRKTLHGTFDNSATTDELRYLALMFDATQDARYHDAFLKGIDQILKAQYAYGGWPQSYPFGRVDYDKYITFNDGAMARVMFFIKEVATDPHYAFVDDARRKACLAAWDKGVDCILKCQVKVDGKLTAWCQQHDDVTFEPRPARKFELASLTGCETVGICHVQMSIEHPSPQIVQAVDAAVAWLNEVKISGQRLESHREPGHAPRFDVEIVKDPNAPPLWARYYQIGTNRPFFCDRDGVMKFNLSEIGIERRTGYQWLKNWPQSLVEREYPEWKAKLASPATTTAPVFDKQTPAAND